MEGEVPRSEVMTTPSVTNFHQRDISQPNRVLERDSMNITHGREQRSTKPIGVRSYQACQDEPVVGSIRDLLDATSCEPGTDGAAGDGEADDVDGDDVGSLVVGDMLLLVQDVGGRGESSHDECLTIRG